MTNNESNKTDEMKGDPHVNISFLASSTGEWASISGEAAVLTDRATIKKHYTPALKAWVGDMGDGVHTGGPEDPRLAVIRVKGKSSCYALARKNIVSRAAEIAKGAVTGEAAQVHKLRYINGEEIEKWRGVATA